MRHLCYTDRIFWNDTSVGMAQKLNAYVCIYLGWIYDCIIDYSLVRDSKNKNKNLIMTQTNSRRP